jgi:membrane-associated phospholipid phosphatase
VKRLKLTRAAVIAISLGFLWSSHCPSAAAQAQPGFGLYSSPLRQNLSGLAAGDSFSGQARISTADTRISELRPRDISSASAVPQSVNAGGTPDRCDFISAFGACVKDVLHDQRGIWTSPAHLHPRDAIWLAPLAAAVAISIHYDAATLQSVDRTDYGVRFSNAYTHIGSPYVLLGASGAVYALGKLTHNERVRETGVLEIEALADSLFVDEVLKIATNRERPNTGTGAGRFWPDGSGLTLNGSFPSGHATASWAFAHVLVDETPYHRWLHVGIYVLAAGVSVGRVTGRYHFPSDALVGSAIGYLIGGYVYRSHSQYYDAPVFITPVVDGVTNSYGLTVSFHPRSLRRSEMLPFPQMTD